jgi:hypothetical protein
VGAVPAASISSLCTAACRQPDRTARAQFEWALALSNDDHVFHHWLALTLLRQGETAQALRHLEQAAVHSGARQQQAAYAAKLPHWRDRADPGRARIEPPTGR